jgi:hypothetical protein
MQEPLQHSNSWVAGEEPSDPTARGARNELRMAARVLGFRGTARGDVWRGEAGERMQGEGLGRGEEGRGRGEAARRGAPQGLRRGEEGRGRGEAARRGARQGRGGARQGRGREHKMNHTLVVAAGWREAVA